MTHSIRLLKHNTCFYYTSTLNFYELPWVQLPICISRIDSRNDSQMHLVCVSRIDNLCVSRIDSQIHIIHPFALARSIAFVLAGLIAKCTLLENF